MICLLVYYGQLKNVEDFFKFRFSSPGIRARDVNVSEYNILEIGGSRMHDLRLAGWLASSLFVLSFFSARSVCLQCCAELFFPELLTPRKMQRTKRLCDL